MTCCFRHTGREFDSPRVHYKMVMKKYYYERSRLLESEVNIAFEELLWKDDDQTTKWIDELREFVIYEWDIMGVPPTIGQNTDTIKKNFRKLRDYPLHHGKKQFLTKDEDTGKFDVIQNYNKFASGVNQFFPTMLKTKIGTKKNATSIYDYFTDKYRDSFHKIIRRTFKRDSMYSWSKCIEGTDGLRWIQKNQSKNFFIVQQLREKNPIHLTLSSKEIIELFNVDLIDESHITNLPSFDKLDDEKYTYFIREFELGQKIFPAGIQAFRLGLGQPAVNFPALTARWIYEYYTDHIDHDEPLNIYDPSSGWGGRILGAMSSHKKIHYIGTDPNTDNFIDELGITRYEYVADFFNNEILETNAFWEEHKNTHHIFQDGSEVIGNNPEFQSYKGTLDLVFTSPPYFDREQYSDDSEQSFRAYPAYEDWRDNFLKPTLTNAFDSLREDRYLLWNIASIKIGSNKYHPLEDDSIDIIESLGGEYKGKLKMLMTTMTGLNPENVKNCVKVDGSYRKYEPIFVFYKNKA